MSSDRNIYHFPDHARAQLARLLEQEKGKVLLQRLHNIVAQRIQYLEDVLWQVREQGDLDTASGEGLDRIGGIVGESREGRDDATYRLWIRARGRANRSAGRPDDILEILRLVLGPDATLDYADIPDRDAEAYVSISNPDNADLMQVVRIVKEIIPAGVNFFLFLGVDDALAFNFDGGPGLGFDEGQFIDRIA